MRPCFIQNPFVWYILLAVFCDGLPTSAQTHDTTLPTYSIAVVKDGPSWYFDEAVRLSLQELKGMANGKYNLNIREEFDAKYNADQVSTLLDQALTDPTINIIYAAGVIATERAAKLPESARTKPIMAGALQFSEVRGQPISPEGTSRVNNYTFITQPQRVRADLETLKRLSNTNVVHIIVDERILPELSNLDTATDTLEKQIGIVLGGIIPVDPFAKTALSRVPANVKAMYVAVLPRMPDAERSRLFEGLAERGIITVSMVGWRDVRLGALAGLAPDDRQAVSRRTALNIHQILNGVPTTSLPVYLPVNDRLILNAKAAQTAKWSPDYETVLTSEMINEDIYYQGEDLSLLDAIKMAATNNPSVVAAQANTDIETENFRSAKAAVLPQLDAVGNYNYTDVSDPIASESPSETDTLSYGAQLRQVLFSDRTFADVKSGTRTAAAAALEQRSIVLDAMQTAVTAYFEYLSSVALYEIEKKNMRLTENNLQLARLRVDIGASEQTEVFRWQQDRARSKARVFQRDADRANALVALNRSMGLDTTTTWDIEDIELRDDEFYFLDNQLELIISDASKWLDFCNFIRWFAVENSPELAAFDYNLAAAGIRLRQQQRRYLLPEIFGTAGYTEVDQDTNLTSRDSEGQFTAGIELSYPLFEGGGRGVDIRRQKANIRQLAAQRELARHQIEEQTHQAFNNLSGTHPNIRFSRLAEQAAQKNYESVQIKYSQGSATVLDLLDAQSSLLTQNQQAALAVYDFLTQVFAMQRAMAWYEFEQSPSDQRRWIALLKQYMETGSSIEDSQTLTIPKPLEKIRKEADRTIQRSGI